MWVNIWIILIFLRTYALSLILLHVKSRANLHRLKASINWPAGWRLVTVILGGAATPSNKDLRKTKQLHVFHGGADCYDIWHLFYCTNQLWDFCILLWCSGRFRDYWDQSIWDHDHLRPCSLPCNAPFHRYEEFSSFCSVLKCECIYDPAWITLDTEGRNLAKRQMESHLEKFQVSRKEVEGIIKIWFTANLNSFTSTWPKMNVI